MTEEELTSFGWNDIAITKINNDDAVLIILLFRTMELGNSFIEKILSKNYYSFEIKLRERDRRYSFFISFKDSDELVMEFRSQLGPENYPPVSWLNQGIPTFITNGIWTEGKQFRYNEDLLPLNEKLENSSLEESVESAFSKAVRIDFYPENESVSMVILVFDKPQAITAYNDLADLVNHKTTFFKITENENLEISFIDAVEDFHITIKNINYNKEQLAKFKETLPLNKTFGFVLGLNNKEGSRPILLPTSNDFRIITLAGRMD